MQKMYFFFIFFIAILSSSIQAQNSIPVDQYDIRIKDSNVVVLDVRTSAEFNTGHIKNALQADWTNRVQFDDRTQYLDKNKTVYVYCQSGDDQILQLKFCANKAILL
jgi:rhodanese-related sulfurtransferase